MPRDKLARRSGLRPTVQNLEGRLLLTGGRLDPNFAGGTGYYLGNALASDVASLNLVQVEPDNSIIAAGAIGPAAVEAAHTIGIIHVESNGTLDTSFGTDGQAVIADPSGISLDGPSSLLLQPDGKILVTSVGSNSSDSFAVVARLDSNGQPDSTFGTNGVEVVDLTTLGLTGASLPYSALQSNGDIVLVGTSSLTTSSDTTTQIAAVRLQSDGAVDTTFGTNGAITVSNLAANGLTSGAGELADGVVIQANGQIVILAHIAYGFTTAESIPELIRLNTDGSIDSTISQAGLTASGITVPEEMVQEPDGDLLVEGTPYPASPGIGSTGPSMIVELNAGGNLTATATLPPAQMFDDSGATFSEASITQMALQPNGDVALLGSGFLPATTGTSNVQTIRLTPSLTPDITYGTDGVSNVTISPPGQGTINVTNLAVGSNNQIVLVGTGTVATGSQQTQVQDYAVARLTATAPAVPGDLTGDGISDLAVYLPASGSFAIRPSSGGADEIIPFGIPGPGQTIPAIGDYTGSGVEEIGAYLPSQGVYAYRPAGGGPDVLEAFGIPGAGQSIPVPGDYFGTGQDDIAVYMPSIGSFGIRNPDGGPDEIIPFGIAGAGQSIPAPGDYFGTGVTDLAVYLPSLGAFAIRNPAGGPDEIIPFGIPGAGNSIPIPGDYDGSGKTELAVYLPKLGEFAYRPADGGPDVIVPFGSPNSGSLPMPGDYDGSGKTEIAIYDPTYGSFAYRPADGGPDVIESFGTPGPGASIPLATPAGALPEFGAPPSTTVQAESVQAADSAISARSVSSTSKRIGLTAVNQGDSGAGDGLI